jgi:tetratricopeptide (TPR) repeat protein
MVEALTQAFENRDRLTERERYMATAAYHESVTGDMQLTIAAYQNLLEIDPEHTGASNNLGVMYEIVRDFDRAEETYALSASLATTSQPAYVNLVSARFHQGDASGAGAALEEALARFPDNPAVEWHDYQHAAVIGDYETADSLASDMDETYGTDLFWRAAVAADRGAIAAATGRLEEARTYLRSATTANQDRRLSAEVLRMAEKEAWLDIVVREDRSASVSRVEAALGRYPLEGIDPLERPYLPISQIYAEAGRPEVARPFRLSDRGSCYACAYRGLADAYLAAGNRDSALALYERYVETPDLYRYWGHGPYTTADIGPTYERLGQLHDEAGNLEKAAEYYAKFVGLWANADAELQPRVSAAQARLEEIVKERG